MSQEPDLRHYLRLRAQCLKKIRMFFEGRDVIEVDTPSLGQAASTDPHLHSFSVHSPHHGACGYLQTSPEFFMKRLLAMGSGSIYQIGKAFREGEIGRLHRPEFTLLEWYRVGFDYHQLIDEVALLMECVLGERCSSWEKYSYQAIVQQYLGINPHGASREDLISAAKSKQMDVDVLKDLDQSGCLDAVFSFLVQPNLRQLTFIYDYPASQAMLAQIRESKTPLDPPVAMRFEMFLEGVELANGFFELRDKQEQEQRFHSDLKKRQHLGLPSVPMDKEFLACLGEAFPVCSGVALGVDRLIMFVCQQSTIHSCFF